MKRPQQFCTIIFLTFLPLGGCAHLAETGKKIWGSSIAHLEKARATAETSKIAMPPEECFEKTVAILERSGVLVYLKDNDGKYLAAMGFKGYVDTTEVGIFFTRVEDGMTQVEVASMNPSLARDAAKMIFSGL